MQYLLYFALMFQYFFHLMIVLHATGVDCTIQSVNESLFLLDFRDSVGLQPTLSQKLMTILILLSV
jgi:hypothetical protein